ncbi:class Ib ribonucleoside-diphosphate reductase assembly flavoprotein NrdI [Mycoplasmoides genitalium]|uniref:class Ib ribonucleoside-diphosphate reductase assembly flavoprotein NrdI n=1 Tax=Mycoplasmoides genitalium TaxID=2097 RepID=UPI00027B389F|nr:class Ib ribonucleoside-diphosphate reductase assembly flavoprotein NrdI [Mycoplasmoides genitalium]AFQ03550.1 ribonucleotide reductase stimulatory protein [Mycoplasmoides genitalium M6282]AFQ04553.1 ribonucleotide reductase stimulatory protein [Mycoplasmoides genitalium M2288]
MHKDIKLVKETEIRKPIGSPFIVYFSSISNNTHRFIEKLGFQHKRIPVDITQSITISNEYVLICPTYSGGGNQVEGAVPKQVIQFLNNKHNRELCRGVIASGNTNFGDTFCLAGTVISKKLNVPLLYQFELLGTKNDVEQTQKIIANFFQNSN